MELLEHRTKMGVKQRQVSVTSFASHPVSLGKPIKKRYVTNQDILMIVISLLCLLIGILGVANVPFAGYLGQKKQLILVGLVLSLMAACTKKQIQLFLIAFEARFGASTLQNYDSIFRYNMLDGDVSMPLKAAIIFVFVLPLGLSASYKLFVSGTTIVSLDPAILDFGPVGPPGLVQDSILALMMNASLPILVANKTAYRSDPLYPTWTIISVKTGSFGFNVQVVSDTITALLDAPLAYELSQLQGRIQADEILEFSTFVNATICTLNSTKWSPEQILTTGQILLSL